MSKEKHVKYGLMVFGNGYFCILQMREDVIGQYSKHIDVCIMCTVHTAEKVVWVE